MTIMEVLTLILEIIEIIKLNNKKEITAPLENVTVIFIAKQRGETAYRSNPFHYYYITKQEKVKFF